jgi:hypothetical protein
LQDPGANLVAATWVTGNLYLVRRWSYSSSVDAAYILYDHASGRATLCRGANGNAILDAADASRAFTTCCPDRANSRMIWAVPRGDASANRALRIYASTFSDLWNWREISVQDGDTRLLMPGSRDSGPDALIGLKPMFVASGFLYFGTTVGSSSAVVDVPAMRFYRMPVY